MRDVCTETGDVYPYNPEHKIGTCSRCGEEMIYNIPRMGPNGGFVHKGTVKLMCDDSEVVSRIYGI